MLQLRPYTPKTSGNIVKKRILKLEESILPVFSGDVECINMLYQNSNDCKNTSSPKYFHIRYQKVIQTYTCISQYIFLKRYDYQNGQTQFKNLATNAAKFLKCV